MRVMMRSRSPGGVLELAKKAASMIRVRSSDRACAARIVTDNGSSSYARVWCALYDEQGRRLRFAVEATSPVTLRGSHFLELARRTERCADGIVEVLAIGFDRWFEMMPADIEAMLVEPESGDDPAMRPGASVRWFSCEAARSCKPFPLEIGDLPREQAAIFGA